MAFYLEKVIQIFGECRHLVSSDAVGSVEEELGRVVAGRRYLRDVKFKFLQTFLRTNIKKNNI